MAPATPRPATQSAMRARRAGSSSSQANPLVRAAENARLYEYERGVKDAFDTIVPVLKEISALQHEADFERRAQDIAHREFGFELPPEILADAWIDQLDMRRLYAWCTFHTYRRFCDEFFTQDPLAAVDADSFEGFLQTCGFHTLDITPCADGRLAHLIRYVLRLPHRAVRRKSYAGALFSIEDSLQKWQEVELSRFREGRPNTADAPTRYLKMVSYHFSSVDPHHEGCAAHGSDDAKAAGAGLDLLNGFREAVENSFCCGASIDLLLIGLDTDTDAIRVHVPVADGELSLERYIDALELYTASALSDADRARHDIHDAVRQSAPGVAEGMARLIERLLENNFSQIAYVRAYHGQHYADIGHAERFIGAGVGFEEIQLRNLMYFAYLDTVEEATQDLDVGIKIFTGLNIRHGLPAPIVVRFDYHGNVPGARERAAQRCERVTNAITSRYSDQFERGLLHVMQVVRDCKSDNAEIEVLGCTVNPQVGGGH
ncbi:MAG: carboxysome shell carbonic anhydrase [Gammaproteobacteria bacterium]|nr:carboxysome shell carbonic anhydrase [Gammaproteobacteria bacterium]MCP5135214.1 carboxysome shell carbonic anhydrase [Gammaproteobacteria bacterium]